MKLTNELTKAVIGLRGNRDFAVFVEHLEDYERGAVNALIGARHDDIYTQQGKAIAIMELRVTIKNLLEE